MGRALRASTRTRATLGLRAHSGWAALVVVAGLPRSPAVIDRRRIELIGPGAPRQPYHAAEKLELNEAEQLVRRSIEQARQLAGKAFRAVLADLEEKGHEVVGCGILLGSGRPLTSLEATLASHALIHTAEGEMFRDALAHASQQCKLKVTGVRERELFTRGAAELRIPADQLQRRIDEWGRPLGPPWTRDQKYSALVAWLALASE